VDYVFSSNNEPEQYLLKLGIPFKVTEINRTENINIIKNVCSDRIVYSVNNSQILGNELLSLKGFRFYNIHNGIIPKFRGRPEVCIIYAILNNEKTYGVSLHEIDLGIDTGKCIEIKKFEISPNDTFQSVMLKSIEYYNKLFDESLDSIIKNTYNNYPTNDETSKLYSFKDLEVLRGLKDNQNFKRATHFGVFRVWYKKVFNFIKNEI
jgi:methionyl-tRNA formyltransferase